MENLQAKKIENIFLYGIPLVFSILIFWEFLNGLSYTRYAADDYCFESLVNRAGFLAATEYLLTNSGPYFFAYSLQIGIIALNISPGFYLSFLFLALVVSTKNILVESVFLGKKNTLQVKSLIIFLVFVAISSLLALPSDGPGSFILTTLGWSAGTSRLIALILLLMFLTEILKPKPRYTFLGLLALLISGSDFALAMVASCALIIVWIEKFLRLKKFNYENFKYLALGVLTFGLNILLTQTEGSKNRVIALNNGMRQGKSVELNYETFLTAKYNAYRLITEAFSIKVAMIACLIGALLYLIEILESPCDRLKIKQRPGVVLYMSFVTVCIGIFTWLGSVVAYLQSWHFIAFIFMFYLTICLSIRHILWIVPNLSDMILVSKFRLLLYSFVFGFLGLVSYVEVEKFTSTVYERSILFDSRIENKKLSDVPIRDFRNNPLTEDLNSEWVKNCFFSARNS